MTETQGDYLGCLIVLVGIVPLLIAVQRAGRGELKAARRLVASSIVLSLVGVLTVIFT